MPRVESMSKQRLVIVVASPAEAVLHELRDRLTELPRDREIIAYCQNGQRRLISRTRHGLVS